MVHGLILQVYLLNWIIIEIRPQITLTKSYSGVLAPRCFRAIWIELRQHLVELWALLEIIKWRVIILVIIRRRLYFSILPQNGWTPSGHCFAIDFAYFLKTYFILISMKRPETSEYRYFPHVFSQIF